MEFEGKVVLVTGAASGIGEEASISFAKLGARVVMVDLDEASLKIVAEKIQANGSLPPLRIAADVVQNSSPIIIEEVIHHFGRLDVLVNNAGIVRIDTASSVDLDTFDEIFAVNCRAVVELTKLAIPHLEKTKGNVVNVSSIAGMGPTAAIMSYCMSKAALNMFTKCASIELAPRGIRVNAVNPGHVETPIHKTYGLDDESIKIMLDKCKEDYPVGRLGEPSDIVNAILFLANEKSGFINGALLVVDGGRINA